MRCTNLLHYASLPLRECDVTTRLVLYEFDVDLPPLAAGLVIIVVVIVGSSGHAWALYTSSVTVAIAGECVVSAGAVLGIRVLNVGHGATVWRA